MPKLARSYIIFSVTLCVALLAICALVVVAQSGRRVRKSEAMPIPLPEATPTPTPVVKPKPAYSFVVGMDNFHDFSRVSGYAFSGVLQNLTGRLNDSPLVKAEISTRDMSRADAVRMAKAEKESYIVWVEPRADSFSDQGEIYISYSVLAPVTAKTATQGSTYPRAYQNKGVNLPSSTTNGDYYLNLAARGAAERILDHFHVTIHR
jgi:hypothetical protein